MAMIVSSIFIFLLMSLYSIYLARAQSFIGVNYGRVADNLPPPSATANLLQSTTIEKVRLYNADPAIINALANTGIGIVIGVEDGDIPRLASDPSYAGQWVGSYVLAHYPASKIIVVTVGNEVMTSADQNLISVILPAMQNVQNALNAASLGGKIKVSTVHSMAVLSVSFPPSLGIFNPSFGDTMKAILTFQRSIGSPFMINPYPYYAYNGDRSTEVLAYCLFQPNAGVIDSGSGMKYMNMFDAQVDAIRSALNVMGFEDIEIVVAATGWPYKGGPNDLGATIDNAKAYNGNLINHLRSLVGTPLMPGKSVDTYIFALYDGDLKHGSTFERAFGLLNPDLSMTYDVGLSKSSPNTTPTNPATPTMPTTPVAPSPKQGGWCVPKSGVSVAQLQDNLDYACGQGIDCSLIQPGGACFVPNTVASHATFAMNLYYQRAGMNPWNCYFSQTATLTFSDPSYGGCNYPGGSTQKNYPGGSTLSDRLVAQGSGKSSTSGAPLKHLYYLPTHIGVMLLFLLFLGQL